MARSFSLRSFNVWSLLLKLPQFIKGPVLRRVVAFPGEVAPTLRFKVAETESELSQAFRLLHDAYVKEKLMDPHPSGMRITKYHMLPSTTTLVAIENGIVVGTVSLIRQSSFGLPLKSIFEIDNIPAGSRLAEVSALAIKKEYLHQRGRILFPLLKFLYHYSRDCFGVTHFVIAVNPKWIDFYKSILIFKPLSKKTVENYSFVNGAPAVGGILNLNTAHEIYYKYYNKRPSRRNLYHFFMKLPKINMEFPLRKKSIISDPKLTPELLQHFFIHKSDCLKSMNEIELSILREMYDSPGYQNLIPTSPIATFRRKRTQKRLETQLAARLVHPDGQSTETTIQDVSTSGVGGFISTTDLDLNVPRRILVNIEEHTPCELVGCFVRLRMNGSFGFQLSEPNHRWAEFVKNLDDRPREAADPGTKPVLHILKAIG